jgi:hypothetical protein
VSSATGLGNSAVVSTFWVDEALRACQIGTCLAYAEDVSDDGSSRQTRRPHRDPAEFRRRLGLKPGDPLVLRLDQDGVVIESRRAAVRAAQRMIREQVPKGELLTERLFAMRRAENTRD